MTGTAAMEIVCMDVVLLNWETELAIKSATTSAATMTEVIAKLT
eukprot:CAMPEP_0204900206 /NCGR_PEP_ID=MMETSP1397-20131031/2329_1 /ASSEMBLY_ACC=CAM_ASM_000891 /TAXON_ID=49980 /ORGANISM="Climacostomum Climacostomum virens, Strain Stock W-24" /LENGTH=43 /DNA_ID= /DNA_START= /DNA_END= /DNA_ORIENTATION=